jgi:hypothetical protein
MIRWPAAHTITTPSRYDEVASTCGYSPRHPSGLGGSLRLHGIPRSHTLKPGSGCRVPPMGASAALRISHIADFTQLLRCYAMRM